MKRRINKKNLTKVLLGIIFVLILVFLAVIFLNGNGAKKNYSKYISVIKDTSLYNSKNKKVGKIYKNAYFELDEYKSGKYFKIKD